MKKIFILLIIVIMYITTSELNAKRKAESFCDSIAIGQSEKSLLENAIDAGSRASGSYWETDGDGSTKTLNATFTGYYPGSDFICKIDTVNGAVVAKHPGYASSLLQ
jgi:hypothetical protein